MTAGHRQRPSRVSRSITKAFCLRLISVGGPIPYRPTGFDLDALGNATMTVCVLFRLDFYAGSP